MFVLHKWSGKVGVILSIDHGDNGGLTVQFDDKEFPSPLTWNDVTKLWN